ncbi:hypothetical protein [Edwardsiella ictaluri]|uniref:Uncharacterized protein n=2 Tax=Edwardsiella ictaluri TaxID=67780 RepID=C5BAJ2_EDWI9|nr:hypothetical protein [Edwardsiella ictaluri]ACR70199.1 hypothetical protein NT01EI_3047 [Edwardsiella ictaluri 93-146]
MKVAQGQSALSGAATGEIVGMLAIEIYQKPVDKLSEKQTV